MDLKCLKWTTSYQEKDKRNKEGTKREKDHLKNYLTALLADSASGYADLHP